MDDNVVGTDSPAVETPGRAWFGDLWRIGFIILMALAVRGWIVKHAQVISRDGVGFIRYAMELADPPVSAVHPDQQLSIADVLRKSDHPPGYSLFILAVSRPVCAFLGATNSLSLALSAQIASLLASLLLTVPMYFLGKRIFGRTTAFVATLLFQALPINAQVAGDGLSDSLFLTISTTALWFTALGFRRSSSAWFAAAGLTSGLAYLVRPEGLLIVAVTGVVIVMFTIQASRRTTLRHIGALALGATIVAAPYVVTIGRLTNKQTGEGLLHWIQGKPMTPGWVAHPPVAPAAVNFPLAEYDHNVINGELPGAAWAASALCRELLKASFYVLPLFSAIGLALFWPRVKSDPAMMLLVALGLAHTLLLWAVAKGAGYVAERHTLLIVWCGIYFAAASFGPLGERLSAIPRLRRVGPASFWSAAIAATLVLAAAPAGFKTLHAGRGGHRAAGLWIAAQHEPKAQIIDPFSWCDYYAGNVREPSGPHADKPIVYSIMENGVNEHQRLHLMRFARFFSKRSPIVYRWPENVPESQAKVLVYRWEGANVAELMNQADRSKTPAPE